ncbi:DsbE family thiol:disulfide interchange protein [Photobacterium chitinilyticum]|uniref:DsbE family thiol:disulfide interchange protein n=1 Tax=Photobacterium chitinilyticum TaxID=2485123 RepID=A0A444JV59_9GAMM|nr:DsbE family thiol:disulfide interchange protein [Photobacterium chitinilyticum]RWX56959.1 DsbE family thiol:disulfide interchange protein [Photobacterium chitinilyticum]
MKITRFLPLVFVLLAGSIIVLAMRAESTAVISPLQGQSIPEFSLASLENEQLTMTETSLTGEIQLLNVWASWCGVCKSEHPLLMDLAQQDKVRVIGLNYRDDRLAALKELQQSGNPYQAVIFDPKGSLAIDLGVYGTPESYLIDQHGVIRHRYVGALTRQIWEREFAPILKQLSVSGSLRESSDG